MEPKTTTSLTQLKTLAFIPKRLALPAKKRATPYKNYCLLLWSQKRKSNSLVAIQDEAPSSFSIVSWRASPTRMSSLNSPSYVFGELRYHQAFWRQWELKNNKRLMDLYSRCPHPQHTHFQRDDLGPHEATINSFPLKGYPVSHLISARDLEFQLWCAYMYSFILIFVHGIYIVEYLHEFIQAPVVLSESPLRLYIFGFMPKQE